MTDIIFDFDGTIADSFEYVLGFLSHEAGKTVPEGEAAREYRGLSMKDMALKLGIPFWRLPMLYFRGRRVMRAHMEHVAAFAGMPELIKQLHDEDDRLYIVSSNSGKNIRRFLKRYEIEGCFRAVRGGAGIWGKVTITRRLCRRFKIVPKDVWYIGDEIGDIASAKAVGMKMLAVTWGFAERDAIERFDPTAIANTPAEIQPALQST